MNNLKKEFVSECLDLGATRGKQAVIDGAKDIARRKVEELRIFVTDSEGADHRQRVLAMCAFEAVLKGALRTLETGAGFVSYLLSMVGGGGSSSQDGGFMVSPPDHCLSILRLLLEVLLVLQSEQQLQLGSLSALSELQLYLEPTSSIVT